MASMVFLNRGVLLGAYLDTDTFWIRFVRNEDLFMRSSKGDFYLWITANTGVRKNPNYDYEEIQFHTCCFAKLIFST